MRFQPGFQLLQRLVIAILRCGTGDTEPPRPGAMSGGDLGQGQPELLARGQHEDDAVAAQGPLGERVDASAFGPERRGEELGISPTGAAIGRPFCKAGSPLGAMSQTVPVYGRWLHAGLVRLTSL